MKKISLKNFNLKEIEQLSREQLKNVLGGYVPKATDVTLPGDPTGTTTYAQSGTRCSSDQHLCKCKSGAEYCIPSDMDCVHACPEDSI
ncbi:hypothetical protein [Sphingobacterium sp. WOUb80]|uniref:hypothetical protein n=1 Tax=Sphingobacterium sp. WOUb80 TaxID=3234028 RepID=UPI003CE8BB23